MPFEPFQALREAALSVLLDVRPPQAIFDVQVTPEPEGALVTFRTTRPAFATVELFRMVTGKVDLDMEKENRERIEVELFGSARTLHRLRFFDLPQERRFWFRISVPGEGPGTALGQKKVRHRGWFSTFRRTATLRISNIKILSDSDAESAGDLFFEVGAYDAARSDARLDFALTDERTVESGGRIQDPFGRALDLGRAPDRVAVHVWGTDDDENHLVSFFVAPWEGLNLRGRQPPLHRPPVEGPFSDRLQDSNDLEVVASLPVVVGRHEVRVTGITPVAALAFEILGVIDCTVQDVLGQPARVRWNRMRAGALATPDRPAGQKAHSGSLLLALGEAGGLLWREAGARTGWSELAGPPLRLVRLVGREAAPTLLVGVDLEGRLHAAALPEPPPAEPCWRPVGLAQAADARRAPAVLGVPDGAWLALRDPAGRLLLLALDGEGRPAGEPRVLADGLADDPVLARDPRGASWLAVRERSGRVLAGPLTGSGLQPVEGPVEELLGIGFDPEAGVVLAGLDGEGRVIGRAVAGGEGWVRFGALQDLLEPESLEPPAPEAEAAG